MEIMEIMDTHNNVMSNGLLQLLVDRGSQVKPSARGVTLGNARDWGRTGDEMSEPVP